MSFDELDFLSSVPWEGSTLGLDDYQSPFVTRPAGRPVNQAGPSRSSSPALASGSPFDLVVEKVQGRLAKAAKRERARAPDLETLVKRAESRLQTQAARQARQAGFFDQDVKRTESKLRTAAAKAGGFAGSLAAVESRLQARALRDAVLSPRFAAGLGSLKQGKPGTTGPGFYSKPSKPRKDSKGNRLFVSLVSLVTAPPPAKPSPTARGVAGFSRGRGASSALGSTKSARSSGRDRRQLALELVPNCRPRPEGTTDNKHGRNSAAFVPWCK